MQIICVKKSYLKLKFLWKIDIVQVWHFAEFSYIIYNSFAAMDIKINLWFYFV